MGLVEVLVLAREGNDRRPELLALDVLVDSVPDVVGLADVELVLGYFARWRPSQEVHTRPAILSALARLQIVAAGGDQAKTRPVGLLHQAEPVGPSIGEIQPDGGAKGLQPVRHDAQDTRSQTERVHLASLGRPGGGWRA